VLLPASPQDSVAPAKPALEPREVDFAINFERSSYFEP